MIGPDDQDLVSALRWALTELKRRRQQQSETPAENQAWLTLYRAEGELVSFWRDMETMAAEAERARALEIYR